MKKLLLLVIAAASACGGDDNNTHAITNELTLAIDPASVSLAAGTSTSATLHLHRTGTLAGATVTLTASALPPGVTASFDAATTTADSAVVTIAVGPSVTAQNTSFTVIAASGGKGATADVAVTITPAAAITVTGTVVDGGYAPTTGGSAAVWGHGASEPVIVAVSAGAFVAEGIIPPYDVVVSGPTGDTLTLGLTRADPLIYDRGQDATQVGDTLSGNFTPSSGLDGNTRTAISVYCDGALGAASYEGATAAYSLDLFGVRTSHTCTRQAVRAEADGSTTLRPTYLGVASDTITVTAGANPGDITLAAVGTTTIHVHIAGLAGVSTFGAQLVMRANGAELAAIDNQQTLPAAEAADFTVTAPSTGAVKVLLVLSWVYDSGSGPLEILKVPLEPSTTDVTVAVHTPPSILEPVNGQNDFDIENGVYAIDDSQAVLRVFVFNPYLDPSHALRFVVTTDSVLPMATLAKYRMPLSRGVVYLSAVEQFDGLATPDDFAQVQLAPVMTNPGAEFRTAN